MKQRKKRVLPWGNRFLLERCSGCRRSIVGIGVESELLEFLLRIVGRTDNSSQALLLLRLLCSNSWLENVPLCWFFSHCLAVRLREGQIGLQVTGLLGKRDVNGTGVSLHSSW